MPIYKGSEKLKDIAITGQNTNCLTHIPQDVKIELDPLNATITGSVKVDGGGIATGFSTSSYLTTPKGFSVPTTSFEAVAKVTPTSFSGTDIIFFCSNSWAVQFSSNKLTFWLYSGSSFTKRIESSSTFNVGTAYWVKVTWNGSVFTLLSSTNGTNYASLGTYTSSTFPSSSSVVAIGLNNANSVFPFAGSIDVSQSYIKRNGSTWWKGGTGKVTLKAGTIATFPDGTVDLSSTYPIGSTYKNNNLKVVSTHYTAGKFFVRAEVQNDVSLYSTGTATVETYFFVNANNGAFGWYGVASTHSGTTKPTSGQCWYDTTNNVINLSSDAFSTYSKIPYSLPICKFLRTYGTVTSINQKFNGLGYIGSTVFVLPNVKGLIPNGRNTDGTLKSIEFEVSSVITYSRDLSQQSVPLWYKSDNTLLFSKGWEYDGTTNTVTANAGTSTGLYCHIATADLNTGVVSSFTPKAVQSPLKPVYIDKVYKGSTLVYQGAYKANQVVFEKSTAGTYSVNLEKAGLYEITVVGGGGAAAMRGVYDDKGYGWTGGSGGAFVGTFVLERGTRTVVVGKANNNTTAQSGNSQTLNPTDTNTYPSSVSGVVSVGGGGSGHYNSSYVGAAGAAATLTMTPVSTTLNTAGNAGNSGSGGKGGGAGATINGGASVYNGYGKGQGCVVSEYANKRSWINGTAGYVKIVYKGRRP